MYVYQSTYVIHVVGILVVVVAVVVAVQLLCGLMGLFCP